ncbi:hypothetical protein C2845_PM09G16200 [Panicum miliaceum]|uniref:Uncharacterized protein n=1 Tax=Panicum miliaceum TaxID=4540 RepID=A0A3L6RYU4_PANMI|nr:hypothetical protein C2845_PM09G16200 [Panicum miliaceum]
MMGLPASSSARMQPALQKVGGGAVLSGAEQELHEVLPGERGEVVLHVLEDEVEAVGEAGGDDALQPHHVGPRRGRDLPSPAVALRDDLLAAAAAAELQGTDVGTGAGAGADDSEEGWDLTSLAAALWADLLAAAAAKLEGAGAAAPPRRRRIPQ